MRARPTRSTREPEQPPDEPLSAYHAAMHPLTRVQHRQFVKAALAGESYVNAAAYAGYRRADAVVYLLGLRPIAHCLQQLAPLLADQVHARRLLEPFATRALARNLGPTIAAATRISAARELTAPASLLDPHAVSARGAQGGAGGPARGDAWTRRKREAQARRDAAREGSAVPVGSSPVPEGPTDLEPSDLSTAPARGNA